MEACPNLSGVYLAGEEVARLLTRSDVACEEGIWAIGAGGSLRWRRYNVSTH